MRRPGPMLLSLALVALLAGCATAPSGRSQLILVSDADMDRMGASAFDQVKAGGKLANDPTRLRQLRCITDALVPVLPPERRRQAWEVVLIQDDSPNAFALPGGKIGVNTGLFKVASDTDQVAAVIGHELGHVVSRHAAERVSQRFATETALQVLNSATGGERQQLLGLLGVGAQAGVLLPFSRQHETEADLLGQRYMAEAGFDPAAAATVWQNMVRATGGSRVPTLLSTHPDPERRIRALQDAAPGLEATYARARAAGRRPDCR